MDGVELTPSSLEVHDERCTRVLGARENRQSQTSAERCRRESCEQMMGVVENGPGKARSSLASYGRCLRYWVVSPATACAWAKSRRRLIGSRSARFDTQNLCAAKIRGSGTTRRNGPPFSSIAIASKAGVFSSHAKPAISTATNSSSAFNSLPTLLPLRGRKRFDQIDEISVAVHRAERCG